MGAINHMPVPSYKAVNVWSFKNNNNKKKEQETKIEALLQFQ